MAQLDLTVDVLRGELTALRVKLVRNPKVSSKRAREFI